MKLSGAIPVWILAASAALGASAAAAEIYRCQGDDGSLVFSDLPCADDAELHRSNGDLSVVAAADSLDRAAVANRAFIEGRRAELREQHRKARERERQRQLRQSLESRNGPEDADVIPRRLTRQELNRVLAERREAELRRRDLATARDDDRQAGNNAAGRERRTLLSRSGGSRERILD